MNSLFFERLLRGRAGLAAAATLIALVLAIIIPGWIMVNVVTNHLNMLKHNPPFFFLIMLCLLAVSPSTSGQGLSYSRYAG